MVRSLLLSRLYKIFGMVLFCATLCSAQGIITTVAGNGTAGFSGDGGPAINATLNGAQITAVGSDGSLYIVDWHNNRIRKVSPTGIISTVAGNGVADFSGDGGSATSASLNSPLGLAVDKAGNFYIADTGNSRIRKVDTTGIIRTIAGNGQIAFSGDGGPATSASLDAPVRVALDPEGNLYIADQSNQRIRKVDAYGIITTVAGSGPGGRFAVGFSGDGGLATSAAFNNPTAVAVDDAGNIYISDQLNHRVRKVDTKGIVTTIAGNGNAAFSGDGGAAINASLDDPAGLAVDAAGNVYVGDNVNARVRRIDPSGIISTVAGNGTTGYSGDGGLATSASINNPFGVALDSSGGLYIADGGNNRIRKVTLPAGPPTISPGGLVNGASFSKLPPAAASIASMFGTNYGAATVVATTLPLPTSLGGVSVVIKSVSTTQSGVNTKSVLPVGGINAPLFAVTPGQINFQVPVELNDQTQATATVSVNGIIGNTFTFDVATYNPAIFATNRQGSGQGVILIASTGELVAPIGSIPGAATRPAKRGEFITIYCTGLGPVTNQPADGAPASSNPLSVTITNPTVTVGSVAAPQGEGFFSGLAPNFVGLYQVNVQIPQDAPTGDAVPLTLSVGGISSNSVTIAVQ